MYLDKHFTPLHYRVYNVVETTIEQTAQHPNGLGFWRGMPLKGPLSLKVLKKRWVGLILGQTFPPSFLSILLRTSLLETGQPNPSASALYTWLLHHVYCDNVSRLY